MSIPLVSISCLTYNHKSYIRDAIESFLMQKTSFKIEILIHDDASTDGTVDIIREYESKFPDLIKPIYQTENQYSKRDGRIRRLQQERARGKYFAICEGDDYWIDQYKLQKQVDFLEENHDYGLVYSKAKVFRQKDARFLKKSVGKPFSSIDDLFIANIIPTPTVLYRSDLVADYLEKVNPYEKNWLMGDYPFWMYIASISKIKFLDTHLSVYRVLEDSAAHSSDYKKELSFINSYLSIKLYYMNELGYSHLESKIFGHYFSSKTRIYLFKNEKNISEVVDEINESHIQSFKIWFLKFIIGKRFLRRILKIYWAN